MCQTHVRCNNKHTRTKTWTRTVKSCQQRDLHWLRSRVRIDFKLALLVYRCLYGLAPRYLSDHFQRVASNNRRRLRSSSSSSLLIRRTRLIAVGDRAFPVTGSRLWNSLPHVVRSTPTPAVFRNRLKTYLFSQFVLALTDAYTV